MVRASAKKAALACLVAAFGVQTTLVYTDERQDPLSEAALRGRTLWHENACQVCHQLDGQGISRSGPHQRRQPHGRVQAGVAPDSEQ